MSALYFTSVLFCIFMTATQACFSCPSCPKTDLQRDFCAASFVLHAKVLSGPTQEVTPEDEELKKISSYDPHDVYRLKIVKIFKGGEKITKLPGIQFTGIRNESLVIKYHTPAAWWKFCIPSLSALDRGHDYLLSGYIEEGKLRSSFCDVRRTWDSVTHKQKRGLKGQYNEKCAPVPVAL